MSKFEDDLARGCLPTGEPLECLYGMGWWTEIPEEEPDPELKPCPFCVSEAGLPTNLDGTPVDYEVTDCTCKNDDCPISEYWIPIKIWQSRPIEDALNARIAELEKDNDEFRQLIHDWIIILTPDDGYVPDSECVRQAMLVIDKEREE